MRSSFWLFFIFPCLFLGSCWRTPEPGPQRIGSGAYRDGSTLTLASNPRVTLLQQIHDMGKRLGDLENDLTKERDALALARRRMSSSDKERGDLSDRLAVLASAEARLETAVQELGRSERELNQLRVRLETTEVERLRAEKTYINLITEIMAIPLDQVQRLNELQQRLKIQVEQMRGVIETKPESPVMTEPKKASHSAPAHGGGH
jgi:chromosome segregation ATPase